MSQANPEAPEIHGSEHEAGGNDPITGLGGLTYTELMQTFTASGAGSWENKDLSAYDVPDGALVEIVVENKEVGSENIGGVRANGSSLNRYFDLHEAEGGGINCVSLHVQADSSGIIEIYAEDTTNIVFTIVGYWS